MYEIKETGGAKMGLVGCTWPFAELLVSKNELQLNASIIGNMYFRPSDVISIERSSFFYGAGIKINHRVNGYSQNVIFSTFAGRDLIKRIEDSGFLNNQGPLPDEIEGKISKYQSSGSFPMKWSALIVFVVIWNLLFLGDQLGYFGKLDGFPLGIGAKLGLAFAFIFAFATLLSEPFSILVLKDGRTAKEIRSFLFFLMAISGLMFTMTSLVPG
jgi:hypothetical protein